MIGTDSEAKLSSPFEHADRPRAGEHGTLPARLGLLPQGEGALHHLGQRRVAVVDRADYACLVTGRRPRVAGAPRVHERHLRPAGDGGGRGHRGRVRGGAPPRSADPRIATPHARRGEGAARPAGTSRTSPSVTERHWTQAQLASALGSSQSRVAKTKAADQSVSMDLLIRSLIVSGASGTKIGEAFATAGRKRPARKSG